MMNANHPAGTHGAYAARALFDAIAAALRSILARVREARERNRQRRQAWATYDALRRLDDRTLRDIGYHRGELKSVAMKLPDRRT